MSTGSTDILAAWLAAFGSRSVREADPLTAFRQLAEHTPARLTLWISPRLGRCFTDGLVAGRGLLTGQVVEVLERELCRPQLSANGPSGSWSAEIRAMVRDTVERVIIQGGELQIVSKPAAASMTAAPHDDGDAPQVHVAPLPDPRPRARKEIIVPGGHDSPPRRVNHALILAIARAKSWTRDLRSGRFADTIEIARQFQLNDAYVRRLLRFAYLAPGIVEAIIEGRQPRSMTVKRLLQGVPSVWADQRAAFGFAR
jgi:hypothetical protein